MTRADRIGTILDDAAALALDWFARRNSLAVDEKPGRQFVSEADRAVERAIRASIDRWFPGDAVLGEEMGGEIAGLTWVIDPIDGTSNFLNGLPLWGVSIGLMDGREPLLGAIALPALGLRLVGGVDMPSLPPPMTPPVPTIAVGWNAALGEQDERRQIAAIRAAGYETVGYRCASASFYFVATGALSGYCEQGLSAWDLAAGVALCGAANLPVEVIWGTSSAPLRVTAGAAATIAGLW